MRASSLVLGPLIARTGMARVAMPGGCAIGGRPIDLHIKGLEKMGATITQEHGYLEARAERLHGAHLVFDKITVTGTEDLLMAAVLAEGETLMENCAREPEVTDLAALLTAMGAQIEGAGTSTIRVQGVTSLHGARYRINPDRIEAGTFLIAGAITGGDLIVANCNPAHLGAVIAKLQEAGVAGRCAWPRCRSRLRNGQAARRRHLDRGVSRLSDRHAGAVHGAGHAGRGRQPGPRKHLRESLHARAGTGAHGRQHQGGRQHGHGARPGAALRPPPSCAPICAPPPRWCWPLWLPTARSILDRVYHMDRGYERIEEKLRGVGAQIRRMGNVFPAQGT